jgi:hypothetical protein
LAAERGQRANKIQRQRPAHRTDIYNPIDWFDFGQTNVGEEFHCESQRAQNAAGTGLMKEDVITVLPYPTAALGTYQGIVPRHSEVTLNNNLGGRLTLTTTNLGAFSGTLTAWHREASVQRLHC